MSLTVTQRVTNILKYSMDARNSDKQLWIIYAQKSGLNLTPEQIKIINDMPEFETIRRVRQKIQEDKQYQADPEVKAQRAAKREMIKDAFGASESELAIDLINRPSPDWMSGIAGNL